MLQRRSLLAATAGVLSAPAILRAQSVQKLTFYYPVAVGGPIAAIIDGTAQIGMSSRHAKPAEVGAASGKARAIRRMMPSISALAAAALTPGLSRPTVWRK